MITTYVHLKDQGWHCDEICCKILWVSKEVSPVIQILLELLMSFNTASFHRPFDHPIFFHKNVSCLVPHHQISLKHVAQLISCPEEFCHSLCMIINSQLICFSKTFKKHQQTHCFFLVAPSKALELGRRYGLWFGWCWRWGCSCGSAEEWFVWWDFFTGRELRARGHGVGTEVRWRQVEYLFLWTWVRNVGIDLSPALKEKQRQLKKNTQP